MIRADVLIVGGGIAGLWLLRTLMAAGYTVLLLDRAACGTGQTIASQGMLHDGKKYRAFPLGRVQRALAQSLRLWSSALNGEGPVNLAGTVVASPSQQLWLAPGVWSRLAQALGAMPDALARAEWPELLAGNGFAGSVRVSSHPVLDMEALLEKLLDGVRDNVREVREGVRLAKAAVNSIGSVHLPSGDQVFARCFVFAAGAGNEALIESLGLELKTQRRPLRQLIARGAPARLFCHYLDRSDRPKLTITSHTTGDGEIAWYCGGQVAEPDVVANERDGIELAQRYLRQLLPRARLDALRWSSWSVDRAEPATPAGARPHEPVIERRANAVFLWPVKLTLAPLLAQRAVAVIQQLVGRPEQHRQSAEWLSLPAPTVASPPWR